MSNQGKALYTRVKSRAKASKEQIAARAPLSSKNSKTQSQKKLKATVSGAER